MEHFLTFLSQAASDYGLFVALVIYTLYESRRRELLSAEREDKYIKIVNTLSDDIKEKLADVECTVNNSNERLIKLEAYLTSSKK